MGAENKSVAESHQIKVLSADRNLQESADPLAAVTDVRIRAALQLIGTSLAGGGEGFGHCLTGGAQPVAVRASLQSGDGDNVPCLRAANSALNCPASVGRPLPAHQGNLRAVRLRFDLKPLERIQARIRRHTLCIPIRHVKATNSTLRKRNLIDDARAAH